MYPDAERRAAGIEAGAGRPLTEQVADLLRADAMADVITVLANRAGVPALVVTATDGRDERILPGPGDPVRVTGPRTRLLGWLTGREAGAALRADPGPLPPLPAWL